MFYKTCYSSPIGIITLASDGKNLVGVWLEGQKYFCTTVDEKMLENNSLKVFCDTKNWLDRYFKGEQPQIKELPLAPKGNEFRQAVWQLLCEIPYGKLTTYGELAKKIAKQTGRSTMSAQAVGGAVGHNPISIIIPCHRVVGTNGSLTGYAGGIETKIKLLKHEKIDMTKLFIPPKNITVNIAKNKRTQKLIEQLINVWESSVKATHVFLSESEIENIKKYVPQALKEVEYLTIITDDNNIPLAFMGIENNRLEMLFVNANERGKGFGTKLIKYGIKKYSINELTVNEQNPDALRFYEKNGFKVYKRTETDEQGNPYPLLYMKL